MSVGKPKNDVDNASLLVRADPFEQRQSECTRCHIVRHRKLPFPVAILLSVERREGHVDGTDLRFNPGILRRLYEVRPTWSHLSW